MEKKYVYLIHFLPLFSPFSHLAQLATSQWAYKFLINLRKKRKSNKRVVITRLRSNVQSDLEKQRMNTLPSTAPMQPPPLKWLKASVVKLWQIARVAAPYPKPWLEEMQKKGERKEERISREARRQVPYHKSNPIIKFKHPKHNIYI